MVAKRKESTASPSAPQWTPCLKGDITPALPIHHPDTPWIPAVYRDGTKKSVDLTTLLTDLHEIDDINLGHTSATVAMYRLVISLMYRLIDFTDIGAFENPAARGEDFPLDGAEVDHDDDWQDIKLYLMSKNGGVNKHLIDAYFSQFEDRFYLLHPTAPFLQDPSLMDTLGDMATAGDDIDEQRNKFAAKCRSNPASFRSMSPLAVNPPSAESSEGKNKIVPWGLPEQEFISPEDSAGDRVRHAMVALLYNRYHLASSKIASRTFLLDAGNHITQSNAKISPYRGAVNFVVKFDSLYRTFLHAMDYHPIEDRGLSGQSKYQPETLEWERPIDEQTGYLLGVGRYREFFDVAVPNDRLSSFNLTQASLLITPEYNLESGTMEPLGGSFHMLKSTAFNLEKPYGPTQLMGWNPFLSVKKDGATENSLFVRGEPSLSPYTYLANRNVSEVALFGAPEKQEPPRAVLRWKALEDREGMEAYMKVMVFLCEAHQDRSFNDVLLAIKDVSLVRNDGVGSENIEKWVEAGRSIAGTLVSTIQGAHRNDMSTGDKGGLQLSNSAKSSVQNRFWVFYAALFDANVSQKHVNPVRDKRDVIMSVVEDIFNDFTLHLRITNPLQAASNHNRLRRNTYGALKK